MNVILRLKNLPWSANASHIRKFFNGLNIPEGGVHIVGGDDGDAFIAFASDEDARQAMRLSGQCIDSVAVDLLLSSKSEMLQVIQKSRQQQHTYLNTTPTQTISNIATSQESQTSFSRSSNSLTPLINTTVQSFQNNSDSQKSYLTSTMSHAFPAYNSYNKESFVDEKRIYTGVQPPVAINSYQPNEGYAGYSYDKHFSYPHSNGNQHNMQRAQFQNLQQPVNSNGQFSNNMTGFQNPTRGDAPVRNYKSSVSNHSPSGYSVFNPNENSSFIRNSVNPANISKDPRNSMPHNDPRQGSVRPVYNSDNFSPFSSISSNPSPFRPRPVPSCRLEGFNSITNPVKRNNEIEFSKDLHVPDKKHKMQFSPEKSDFYLLLTTSDPECFTIRGILQEFGSINGINKSAIVKKTGIVIEYEDKDKRVPSGYAVVKLVEKNSFEKALEQREFYINKKKVNISTSTAEQYYAMWGDCHHIMRPNGVKKINPLFYSDKILNLVGFSETATTLDVCKHIGFSESNLHFIFLFQLQSERKIYIKVNSEEKLNELIKFFPSNFNGNKITCSRTSVFNFELARLKSEENSRKPEVQSESEIGSESDEVNTPILKIENIPKSVLAIELLYFLQLNVTQVDLNDPCKYLRLSDSVAYIDVGKLDIAKKVCSQKKTYVKGNMLKIRSISSDEFAKVSKNVSTPKSGNFSCVQIINVPSSASTQDILNLFQIDIGLISLPDRVYRKSDNAILVDIDDEDEFKRVTLVKTKIYKSSTVRLFALAKNKFSNMVQGLLSEFEKNNDQIEQKDLSSTTEMALIKNLPMSVSVPQLKTYLSSYKLYDGDDCIVIKKSSMGKSLGEAIIRFATKADLANAIETVPKKLFSGRIISITKC